MNEAWRAETRRVTRFFDQNAASYRQQFAAELQRKPFDRRLLADVAGRARRTAHAGPVLEVGAGPAHVGAFLAGRGVRVIASDASTGQLDQARTLDPSRPLVGADLARLPARPASLAGIVAFYCLIYGPSDHLDAVFGDWHQALSPGGLVVIAAHAGVGTIGVGNDLTVVLRDPADMLARLQRGGFAIDQHTVRAPYEDEHQTDRLYIVATRLDP